MYLKYGIRNVTMDNVATEFGISKKTLYQYFTDKQDLVAQVVDYFLKDPELRMRNLQSGNAIDDMFCLRNKVAYVMKMYNNNIELELKRTYPALYQQVYETKRQRIYEDTFENLKKGISEGLYRNDLEPSVIAKLLVGRTLYTLNPDNGIFEDYEVSSISFFDIILDYHMHGICTSQGIKYYKKQLNRIQNES